MERQTYKADDSRLSNDAVEQMRAILNGLPIAVAVSAADTIKDDVHRQLQFGHIGFTTAPAPEK